MMNRKLVTWGIALIVTSILLPVLFFLFSIIPFDLIEGIFLGLDWFCCMGWSVLILIGGLSLLIIGIRTN